MAERLSDKNPCNDCKVDRQIGNPNRWECECDSCDKPIDWKNDCVKKLAEYETAEEEGRLVVLPCKVGQCVYTNFSMSGWYMRKGKRPYIGRIVFIGLNADDPYFNIILGEGKMLQFKFSEIGKRVFLAREEAEKALMEIKKGEMTY